MDTNPKNTRVEPLVMARSRRQNSCSHVLSGIRVIRIICGFPVQRFTNFTSEHQIFGRTTDYPDSTDKKYEKKL